jgi:hypothetical protein
MISLKVLSVLSNLSIRIEENSHSLDRDLNPGLSEYEAGMQTAQH